MSLWQIALIVAAVIAAMAVLGVLARWAARAASPPPRTASVSGLGAGPHQSAATNWVMPEPAPAEVPPEVERYAPRRHQDPGADGAFEPKPVAKPANPRLSGKIERAEHNIPKGWLAEIERQTAKDGPFVYYETRQGPCTIKAPPVEVWRVAPRRAGG